MSYRAIIAGGGTGGHVFPALALAQELRERWGSDAVRFVGTERGMEYKLVPERGFELETLEVLPLKRVGLWRKLKGLLVLPKAFFHCRRILKQFKPHVVIGVGGYAAGPMVMTAWLSGYPTAILEQNSIPGFTNRVLSRFVKQIYTGLPTRSFPARKVSLVGNPVRQEVIDASKAAPPAADHFSLFICGGSQGAHAVNEALCQAAPKLAHIKGLRIVHQCGPQDVELCESAYRQAGIEHEVHAFISDIHNSYRKAHFVIARAGAMTISELAAIGRPALLVPFPFAADNHQLFNARYLAGGGGAEIIEQSELSGDKLATLLTNLAIDRVRLTEMTENIKKLGHVDAAATIADSLELRLAKSYKALRAGESKHVSQ